MSFSRLCHLVLASICGLVLLLFATPAPLAQGLSLTPRAKCAKITSFTPTGGPAGTSVTISGCGFTGAIGVTFNGVAASFTVTSDTQISATVPGGAISGKIAVTTPSKTITSGGRFTVPPGVALSPTVGPPTSTITVSGTNFGAAEAVDLYFDTTDEALTTTNTQGAFAGISIPVPASAVPGTHWVTAIGRHSGLGSQASFLVRTDWAQFRSDPTHTGLNPYENVLSPTNVARLNTAWSVATSSFIISSPAVVGGVVYISSADGHLYAFNAQTGIQLWTAPTSSFIESSPAVANGVVYVGSFDSKLYAFDAQTGTQLWTAPTSGIIISSPAVVGGVVYVGSEDTHLYAFDAQTGTQLWTAPTNGAIDSSPAVVGGVVYVGSEEHLYAFDARTGTRLWTAPTNGTAGSSPAVANGVVYVSSQDDNLYAFNARTGTQLWAATTGDNIESSPAVTNGVVYVGSDDHHLYAFNAQTGTQLWAAPTNGAIGSSPVVANGVVYISSADAHVYAFDVQTGTQLWAASTGGPMHSSPVVANGVVYVGSNDGSLYAYTLPAGSQRKAPARPALGSLHPDLRLHVSA